MVEQVVYDLSLRDKLTAGINSADSAVNKLERSLGSVGGLLTGIGVGFAAFKLADFAGQANEEWEKMEFAMSQVEAGIKSTGGAAGLTFEELKKGAEDTSHSLKFTQAEILGMQSVLLTFPAVTKQAFSEASTIIEDMSTRLGTDLKSSAIQVGKALQDPVKGITALRRVGVNFNETQTETIKHLAETNQLAKAQALILQELQVEFGGSAAAAAEADKSFRLDKTMEENKVVLGEFLDQIKEELMPVLISVANGFKNVIVWIKENWKMIKAVTLALGSAWVAFKVFGGAALILQSVGAASAVAATGLAGVGTAATVALGPIGLLAAAIGGVVLAYNLLDEADKKKRKSDADFRSLAEKDTEDYLRQQTAAYEQTMKHTDALAAAKQKYQTEIINSRSAAYDQVMAAEKGSDAEKIAKAKLAYFNDAGNALDNYKDPGIIPTKKTASGTVAPEKVKAATSTKATGSKSVTINVTIQKLGETTLNITNIKEGAKQLHDHIVAALTGAVNDFQIISQNS